MLLNSDGKTKLVNKFTYLLVFAYRVNLQVNMADENEQELLDYEDEEAQETADAGGDAIKQKEGKAKGYVSIHSSGFRDFLLKPELLRAIVDCGFEHPSEGKLGMFIPYSVKLLYKSYPFSCYLGLIVQWNLIVKRSDMTKPSIII